MARSKKRDRGPALAMIDVVDIPVGLRVLDALVKEAPVDVLASGTIQCGRYLVAFAGEVEPVEFALRQAVATAAAALFDVVLLPHAEPRIVPALHDGVVRWPAAGDTLGAVQAGSPPTLLRGIDSALKGTPVELVELRAGDGLGGKAIAMLWGETHDVEAAVALAEQGFAAGRTDGCSTAIVRNADPVTGRALAMRTGFFKEWRG